MKKNIQIIENLFYLLIFLSFSFEAGSIEHPNLLLTKQGVKEIQISLGKYPDFDQSVNELKTIADNALKSEIIVPIPKDEGGGYSHEKHKNNYYEMNAASTMYQLTGKKEYAEFVKQMLLKYAKLYPAIGLHPSRKSNAPGKLFWQLLNDCVWLFHTAMAYDCICDYLNTSDKANIEKNLFRPMAEFISNGNAHNYEIFNKMHNHATWATASVGMIGYVMEDKNLVEKALYGSNKDSKSGFIRQLNILFSPDGYYTEGPYYQRYAIWPFMVFAQVIQNNQPELKIFSYRDSILLKATNTLLQCAYNSEIFYLNDALKKTYQTQEIIYAVDIAYKNYPKNTSLLDIARQQKSFLVADAGIATAKSLHNIKYEPFQFRSLLLRDGENGEKGALGIIRAGKKDRTQTCLTFKATSHGLSHGHYDKLSIVLYDNENCIMPDYGAVRFLNIEPKNGGHYTKENYSWAMQTVAHNTVVVDKTSHFNADIKISSNYHSDIQYYDFNNPDFQIISGCENNAYKNVKMQRTVAIIKNNNFSFPLIIDVFRVVADSTHTLDLPFYYRGQIVSTNFKYQKFTTQLNPLGTKNGYQHLWVDAIGKNKKSTTHFTWLAGNRFYTISALGNTDTEFFMAHSGADDPDFNLRNETCFMIRQPNVQNHTFVTVIEPHGFYDLNKEIIENLQTSISNIELLADNQEYTAIKISIINNKAFLFITLNSNFDKTSEHTINLDNQKFQFKGNYYFSALTK
ncbi:MAG TPA: heparinase II/III family protein [Paludibacteraceae bacterium]|nr:heparinase II/III family protein [Paludibacteraceae bacterium]